MNETVDDFEGVSDIELGRRRYRRRQTIRSVLISAVSTVVFAVVIWLVLENSPGWQVTRETFFSAHYFAATLPEVAVGLWLNVQILFFAVIGVAVLAVILAVLRSLRGPVFFPLRFFAAAYTDLFRGMPFLIVLYLIGFGIPALNPTTRIPAAFPPQPVALVPSFLRPLSAVALLAVGVAFQLPSLPSPLLAFVAPLPSSYVVPPSSASPLPASSPRLPSDVPLPRPSQHLSVPSPPP